MTPLTIFPEKFWCAPTGKPNLVLPWNLVLCLRDALFVVKGKVFLKIGILRDLHFERFYSNCDCWWDYPKNQIQAEKVQVDDFVEMFYLNGALLLYSIQKTVSIWIRKLTVVLWRPKSILLFWHFYFNKFIDSFCENKIKCYIISLYLDSLVNYFLP